MSNIELNSPPISPFDFWEAIMSKSHVDKFNEDFFFRCWMCIPQKYKTKQFYFFHRQRRGRSHKDWVWLGMLIVMRRMRGRKAIGNLFDLGLTKWRIVSRERSFTWTNGDYYRWRREGTVGLNQTKWLSRLHIGGNRDMLINEWKGVDQTVEQSIDNHNLQWRERNEIRKC